MLSPCQSASKKPEQAASSEDALVELWFGTNRTPLGDSKFSNKRPKGDAPDKITLGRCHALVPKDRVMGSLGRGWFKRLLKGDNRVKLRDTEVLQEEDFWKHLAAEVAALDKR